MSAPCRPALALAFALALAWVPATHAAMPSPDAAASAPSTRIAGRSLIPGRGPAASARMVDAAPRPLSPATFGSAEGRGAFDPARAIPPRVTGRFPAPAGSGGGSAPSGVAGIFLPVYPVDVASAGDVDNNSITDWIVGLPFAPAVALSEAGHVTIHQRSTGGVLLVEIAGPAAFAHFGAAVASAGDVNGDGYDEVIVGAPGFDDGRGRAYVYRGTPLGTSPSAPWIIDGIASLEYTGASVAGAGDVNGDGFDDVIVGTPAGSGGPFLAQGRVSCYLGGSTGLSTTPAWTVEGRMSDELLGHHIAGNGDVNADGYADILVASSQFSNGEFHEGRVQLFLGGPGGLAALPAFVYETNAANWGPGANCALPGDLNGDGYGDIVIGLPSADFSGSNEGQVRVYGGSAFPFFLPFLGSLEFGSDEGNYGFDVAPAGDLNGDGFADFLASAPFSTGPSDGIWTEHYGASNFDPTFSYIARVGAAASLSGIALAGGGDAGNGVTEYLVGVANMGSPAPGIPGGAARGGPSNPGMIVLPGVTFDQISYMPPRAFAPGSFYEEGYGQSMAMADVNGDGFADVIVGGPNYSDDVPSQGHVNVYHGGPDGLSPLPPSPAQKDLPALDGGVPFETPDWSYLGQDGPGSFGFSVANAGDTNGDGYEDVLVGAPGVSNGQGSEGAAYLFLGGPDGLSLTPSWRTEGNESPAFHGYGVGGAGDVNQDGYDDILVGAPLASPGGVSGAGRTYLYYGSPYGPSHMPARIFAGSGVQFHMGASCTGIGDVDNDGYPEIALSEVDYGNGQSNEGRVLVYRGGAAGVEALPIFTWEPDVAFAYTGLAITPAGDVNGDGHADLIVGAHGYTGGEVEEGALFLFAGSPLGLAAAPVSFLEADHPGAHLGLRAWSAGDLDKDGYGDVAVGVPGYDPGLPVRRRGEPPAVQGGPTTEGRVDIHFGSPGGLEPFPRLQYGAASTGYAGQIGGGLAGGGDINGDGWPDVAFAAPFASVGKLFQNGVVSVAYANVVGDGLARPTRVLRGDNYTPIAHGLRSDLPTAFRVSGQGRTPAGRGRVRMQWQAKSSGAPFDGTGIGSSAALRTGVPAGDAGSSIQLGGVVAGLASGERYRVRTRYATRHPYFHRTRWFSSHRNGMLEVDLRTAGPTGAVDAGNPGASPLSFAGAWPNPVAGRATLSYALPAAGRVTIDAYDATGRRVARVLEAEAAAGPGAATWDGRDDAGRALPRGLYFLRLGFAGETRSAKVVLAP